MIITVLWSEKSQFFLWSPVPTWSRVQHAGSGHRCEFKLQSYYYIHLWTKIPEKAWTLLFFHLWIKLYHYCFSTRMALSLNNPQRLIYHCRKKPNQFLLSLFQMPFWQGSEYTDCNPWNGLRLPPSPPKKKRVILGMTLNYIWWFDCNSWILGHKFFF